VEIGAFCETPPVWDRAGVSVCDLTGLGVEDLYIAEYCYERLI
jgi:ornithine cyclodeaminase/alanine dehydrogenase-like protein (mu-crystallin family)